MNKSVNLYKIIILLVLTIVNTLNAKVEIPNYNFTLDKLSTFSPEQKISMISKDFGKSEIIEKNTETTIIKYYISHNRYKFPIFIQVFNGIILDYFAKLPSYFLHNVFHQSIINKLGKQDIYLKKENSAIYIWNKNSSRKYVYSAACTITCFPIYYSSSIKKRPKGLLNYVPIIDKLKNNSSFLK